MNTMRRRSIWIGFLLVLSLLLVAIGAWSWWILPTVMSTPVGLTREYVDIVIPDDSIREEITTRLSLRRIAWEATQEGKGLRIQTERVEDIAFIKGFLGQQGYQHLLTDGVGNSRFERRLKYTIALERELERTLSMLEGVEQVKLHIAMTEPKLMGETEKTSVSAFIVDSDLAKRSHIVRSVRSIVGDAVSNLDPRRIEVVFSSTPVYALDNGLDMISVSQVDDPHFESKVVYETYYGNKVKSLLNGLSLAKDSEVIVNVALSNKEVVSRERVPIQGGEQGPVVMESYTTSEMREAKHGNVSSAKKRFLTGTREVTTNQAPRAVMRVDVAIVIRRHIPTHVVESLAQLVRNSIGLDEQSITGIDGRVDIMSLEQVQWAVPVIENNGKEESGQSVQNHHASAADGLAKNGDNDYLIAPIEAY